MYRKNSFHNFKDIEYICFIQIKYNFRILKDIRLDKINYLDKENNLEDKKDIYHHQIMNRFNMNLSMVHTNKKQNYHKFLICIFQLKHNNLLSLYDCIKGKSYLDMKYIFKKNKKI
jgi:hypothetical protein